MCLNCLGFYCTTGLRLRFGAVCRSRHRVMVQLKIFAKLINIVDKNKINVAFFV